MIRFFLFALALTLGSAPLFAQQLPSSVRGAIAKPSAAGAEPAAFTCTTLTGMVQDEKGHPLIGANVVLVGSREYNSTNAEGLFTFAVPPRTQELTLRIGAAGYEEQLVPVTRCDMPPLTLALLPGTRIKHGKRHYGKILETPQSKGKGIK